MSTKPPKAKGRRSKPLLSVLDKMIAQDLLTTLLSVWTVIVVIIVSREFVRVLDKAVQGQVPNDVLLTMLGLKTVAIGVTLLPPAVFMAVLMVLGRMYRDQEMSAIFAAGGGASVIYRAVFLVIFPLTLFTGWCSFYAAPWAETQMEKIYQQGKQSADLRGIAAGKFSDYSQGELIFYVESISKDKTMHQVFVQQRETGKQAVISARSATLQDLPEGRYIVFTDGQRVQGLPGQLNYTIEEFREYAVRIAGQEANLDSSRLAGMAVDALWNSRNINNTAELQRRLSIPMSLFLLSFVGVPLAQVAPRGGTYGNILIGFLIYFSYGNFVRLSQLWVANGSMAVWLGGFAVNAFLVLIAAALLGRFYGWRWLWLRALGKVSA
ncbi:LPS export ABC transporter permease LptF [Methylosoma difficile]